ncbi:NAD(P)H-quinone oxidoreductase [Haliangium ochraceum]|uniref:NAD(P)H quinone oxidoreductase, PIG3 family n=1 Tax=Haliangium ochraceum (strain DSM 14365 / JCM 11303 / SMP-2) TaxID=502025 RepID=D0LWL1_HALO1|nr:NAD(P)H-quinone oxidoreductase [Haliangium ochraceum]ACY17661.1 NAD(P)H quinone oxidoreductase, PIG3 family [Haliangium ochraceum DSM 14365]
MATARAVKIRQPGGVEVLAIDDIELPEPGPGQVLVEVAAAGLNRADTLQRRGMYPAPPGAPADIPGLEFAGTVSALGAGVSDVAVGDRVMGIVGGGGMATHLVTSARELVPVPAQLDLEQAAAIPEVFFTAYDALFEQGGLGLGETALVHAIGSGVGTAALQLGRAAGARILGTSRTQAKLERCAELGLEDGLLVENGCFYDEVCRRTDDVGAQLIIDTVGAAYLEENVRSLALRGRMVVLGLMGGTSGKAPLALILRKRLTITGSVLRARPPEEKMHLARAMADKVVPLFEQGRLAPVIDQTMPMSEIAAAHTRMEENRNFGKIVLRW